MSSECPFTVNTDFAISEMKEAGYEVYVLAVPKHGGLGAWGARSAWHTGFSQGSGVCATIAQYMEYLCHGGQNPGIQLYNQARPESFRKRPRSRYC